MAQYYFFSCALPPLFLGEKPEIAYRDFLHLLEMNVTPSDWDKVLTFRRYIDLKNLKVFWMDQPIDPKGMLNEKELEDALLARDYFPPYVFEFLEENQTPEYRLKHFPQILSQFFSEEIESHSGFIRDFLTFERDYRRLLTALRSSQLKRDVTVELQYEDAKDFVVATIFAQKDATHFECPSEYAELERIFYQDVLNPKQLYFSLLRYRFNKMEEIGRGDYFTIDGILNYLVRFAIAQDWVRLSEKRGREIIDSLLAV